MEDSKTYDIKGTGCWVAPDAGSFLLGHKTDSGDLLKILFVQAEDLEDYSEDAIPGRLYLNHRLVDLKSDEETMILSIFKDRLENNELGHKEGLEVITVKRILNFFNSGEAQRIHLLLSDQKKIDSDNAKD